MTRWLRLTLLLGVPLLLGPALTPRKASAKRLSKADRVGPLTSGAESIPTRERQIQASVDELRAKLSIAEPVSVALVPSNRLVVSVERERDRSAGFALKLEDHFVAQLSDAELYAVLAHELGHVWIFTHHPFLQTEEQANEIALKVVERQTLSDVYDKVWARVGEKGSIQYLPVD